MAQEITRRGAMGMMLGAAGTVLGAGSDSKGQSSMGGGLKGNIKQSASRWCYRKMELGELCDKAKEMGLVGLDLLGLEDAKFVMKKGLLCTMASGPGKIVIGWNRKEHHDNLVEKSEDLIPKLSKAGIENMIVFSGNRAGLSDEEGIQNCAEGLKRIMKLAEKKRVTVHMELLNSKRNHKDYQCDHTKWAVELAREIDSERFKILYDIYHMQIMEGDVIATIKEFHPYIGHYHTGGVPGRHEIDETQELYYPAICKAILEAQFSGYLAHEFTPTREPMESLRQAVKICDV